MSTVRLAPPGGNHSITVNGRVYECPVGSVLDVPAEDASTLQAHGWHTPVDLLREKIEQGADQVRALRVGNLVTKERGELKETVRRMKGVDKLDAAAAAFEKLEDGFSVHGDRLVERMVKTSEKLEEVVTKGHRAMDARDAALDRMDKTLARLDQSFGGNADPTNRSSSDSSTGSTNSDASKG